MNVHPDTSPSSSDKIAYRPSVSGRMTLTKAQRRALFRLYSRNADGAHSYRQFRQRAFPGIGGEYIMVQWCGMHVGIETDGHSHT